jgi:aspartate beta-hydroxylase
MQDAQAVRAEVAQLQAAAIQAQQAGREDEAGQLWARVLERDASHGLALISLGKRAFRYGDLDRAQLAFERLVAAHPDNTQGWVNLALTHQGRKNEAAEQAAIDSALRTDPYDLVALILRANLLERQGLRHKAATVYGAVASVAPPLAALEPGLQGAVTHALQFRDRYDADFGSFLDGFLDNHYQAMAGENLHRFRESVDIMVARKRRYESQSMVFHYPGLLPVPMLPRERFPWLDAIEAGTDAIRAEFLQVHAADRGFTPYLSYPPDMPHNQFAELNNSQRWSAFHLIADGKQVPEHASRCPETMRLLAGAPQPDQPGRTPSAMFSLLAPHTRIPPHVGVSNVRLVTHLPLIIPEKCGFRVGNETRGWNLGEGFVFDDTIEHEAWNDSDKLRVVLIFDIWHPDLTPPERAMITALTEGIQQFRDTAGEFAL